MISFSKKNRIIKNFYQTCYKNNALLSYITSPFIKQSLSHTNFFEATSWAKIISELGYNVDIIDFQNYKVNKINLNKYQLICGFGDVFQHYFENNLNNSTTIYYATGMHVCHQNNATLKRVKDVFLKKQVWLGKSARFVEKTYTHQTTLVDAIIALGNEVCADSYRRYYSGDIFSLNAPFYQTQNAIKIINERVKNNNKDFLWLGSAGLIHKGLDLLLDYFSEHSDIRLHIAGDIYRESNFVEAYKNELNSKNIIVHHFVDIDSIQFEDILKQCAFTLLPSCSEGGSPSVLTAIGNGGLIPIISKEATVSTGNEIWIDTLDKKGITEAVKQALSMDNETLAQHYRHTLGLLEKKSTIGLHPHRGFEICSFVLKGKIRHFDNKQNKWIPLNEGDVQIIRAGSGISHAEEIEAKSEIFQIWFNPDLSKSLKSEASYNDYKNENFPVESKYNFLKKTIKGKNSPINMETENIEIYEYEIQTGKIEISTNKNFTHSFFLLKGKVKINDFRMTKSDFAIINDSEKIKINSLSNSKIFEIKSPTNPSYATYF